MKKIILTGLTGILALNLNGCDYSSSGRTPRTKFETGMDEGLKGEITIPNGKRGSFVRYCGMPNKDIFSLASTYNDSINVFYPTNSKIISLEEEVFDVIEVTPKHITLNFR